MPVDRGIGRTSQVIYLAGADGSGKTTQARHLVDLLTRRGRRVTYVWLRYPQYVSLPVLLISRLLRITRYSLVDGRRTGRWEFHRAPWLAYLLLAAQVIDARLARHVRIEPHLREGSTVILDQFVFDIAVDIAVALRRPEMLTSHLCRLLYGALPPATTMVLDAPPAILRERRPSPESDEVLALRVELYQTVASIANLTIVDASVPEASVSMAIVDILGGKV